MNTYKVRLNFSTYKEVKLVVTGMSIAHQCLKNSNNFQGIVPLVEQLQAATNAFQKEMSRRTSKESKDARRKELITTLTTIGRLVEEQSKNDLAKIYSAGFDIIKKKPVRPLGEAKNFRVKHLGKGEMELRCEPNKNAKGYLWEYRQIDGVRWIQETTTAAKIIVKGLEAGKEYLFRVMLMGKHELRTYSREIKAFAV